GRALLEASVRHARVRVQFGQPVGAFQAVQHRLADVAIGLEFARPLLDAAACALADRQPAAARDVSAAKVACADAAHQAARAALQVHGAIGYTQEHDLSLWLTKVRALIPAWGTQAQHRAEVIAALTAAEQPGQPGQAARPGQAAQPGQAARPGPPEAAWS
ncbi:MAG: acyl-CoA dehydrogenase family protein, partial [Streptosporangiaceae bacterium]